MIKGLLGIASSAVGSKLKGNKSKGYSYVPYDGKFSDYGKTGTVNFKGTTASFDIGTAQDYSDYLSAGDGSDFLEYMSGSTLENAKKQAFKEAQDKYYAKLFAKNNQGQNKEGAAPAPAPVTPYSPQKLNIKSTTSGAPSALAAPTPKAFNDAPYLASIADLKKQLQAQTTLSQQNTQNFQQNLAAMQNQMSANMASYQKSLSDQNLAFSQQMTDMETQNQQSTQLMAQQMAPQKGAQVLGVKTASGPSTMAQKLRRAGIGGSFNRAGLRIKALNIG